MSCTTDVIVRPSPVSLSASHPPCPRAPKARRRLTDLGTAPHFYMDVPPVALGNLSSELLHLVCEQLCLVEYQSLLSLRCVSRRFGSIATPVAYHTIDLNESLTCDDAEYVHKYAFANIARFTRHFMVHDGLELKGIKRILTKANRISSITWYFKAEEAYHSSAWPPPDVLDLEALKEQQTKLIIDNLSMNRFSAESYTATVPGTSLVSLKLASPLPPLTARLNSLKRLLLHSKGLEVLHYQDRGQGTRLDFEDRERLPPLTELSLRSYDWNHSSDEVSRHWDFSRIRSLELIAVPYFKFLSSVPLHVLKNVSSLHIEDWSTHVPDYRREATQLLNCLIRDHIRTLVHLDITCHLNSFNLEGLHRHRKTLQTLRLRDHVGFSDEFFRCPTLHPRDVGWLGQNLPMIQELELDMDSQRCDTELFIHAIPSFQNLRNLTLNVQTVISVMDEAITEVDRDYAAATAIFRALVKGREAMLPDKPWNQIKINVGGWQPVMVRRVGAGWRALNERGIFAERCFIMTRASGRYIIQEEMSIEGRSSRASPVLDPIEEGLVHL